VRIRAIIRQIYVRPRLSLSIVVGIILFLFLPMTMARETRALIAWDIGAGLYLGLAWIMMTQSDIDHMRRSARHQDDGAEAVLALTLIAAIASLAAIILELAGVKHYQPQERSLHLILAGLTILCSWCLVHTTFALHYAHEFYDIHADPLQPRLDFPGNLHPDYLDFLYFSFVIGTTSQTADVSMTSSAMRRIGLVHCIVSFFFNTTLLALTINIAASMT